MDGLDAIRRGEQHHAIGTIYYKNSFVGKLIYMKLSLLGDNNLNATLDQDRYNSSPYRGVNPYIAHYKKNHPDCS